MAGVKLKHVKGEIEALRIRNISLPEAVFSRASENLSKILHRIMAAFRKHS